jgi:hypothetical protein
MAVLNYIVPHMIVDGDQPAMDQVMVEAGYDSTLTGNAIYVEGDLVEVVTGKVRRSAQTTPANVPALFLAGANHAQPFAITRNGQSTRTIVDVPLNVIPDKNEFVMTYQGNAADGANYVFLAADLQAVQARARREIDFNDDATVKAYTVRSGTTNPAVTLLGVFKGAVGDSNVQVLVRLDPAGAAA